ncbi:hypothetical protein [Halolamina salifodinae]|uniref:Glycyl aminopeptidase n=1 Tax=Halolamina salifodinae TaxID=1202767 RepID=A0A8T4H3K4_9EURY|nr:hypothetical protein [Halolamina salifodinae]MBP1988205.1 hypothetical protein [Halolamina salifodinae]
MPRAVAVAFVLLVVLGQPAVATAAPGSGITTASSDAVDAANVPNAATTTETANATVAAAPTIYVDTVLSLTPEQPGSIGVVQTFDTPDEVVGLRVTLDPESTVTESDGFSQIDSRTWEWDGETPTPELRYEMAANRTADRDGPMGADGSYLYTDVGEWALVRQPTVGLRSSYRGDQPISVNRSTRVDGEGAAGEATAFLGAHTVHTRQVAGQEIQLIVPDAADLADPPEQILDGLGNASRAMHVGDRDPRVFAVAAPTGRVGWAVQGLQIGDTDFWTRASRSVDTVGSTWLHEYVHTRQAFRTNESARWFTEASATWYAVLLSQQAGASYDDLTQFLRRGTASPQASAVLADPTSWANNANYWKGALVTGEIDRRIRLATDGGATLQRAFSALNGHTSPITNGDILAAVGNAATAETRSVAERYTTTSDVPAVWNRSAHTEAFGADAALLQVDFDTATDLRATGPYRNASLPAPVTLAAGETLSVRPTVENRGGTAGDYTVTLRAADRVVDEANGTLPPGETATASLARQFTEPGRYTVSVADEQFSVRVREPATPTVTEVAVQPTSVERGGEATVTATVTNDETVPGNATVAFTRDGEQIATETVTLGSDEQVTVTNRVGMPDAGDHRVGVEGNEVDVRVTEPATATPATSTPATSTPATSTTTTPGFGAPAAVGAVGAAIALRRRRSGE